MSENFQSGSINKRIKVGNLIYSINQENKTASIINAISAIGNIIIPRSVTYESEEYLVISILESAFYLSNISAVY